MVGAAPKCNGLISGDFGRHSPVLQDPPVVNRVDTAGYSLPNTRVLSSLVTGLCISSESNCTRTRMSPA